MYSGKWIMEKDNFYRRLTVTGIPMVIQQVISVTLNLADTIMVGKVSENALAAVGAANQVYFIFGVVLFGIFSGAAVHAVQYWGIRDLESLRKIVGIDYTMCLVLSLPCRGVFCGAFFYQTVFRQCRGNHAGYQIPKNRMLLIHFFGYDLCHIL